MKFFLATLCSLVFLGGCYSYAPVEVKVTDAAAGQPVAGIRVKAAYRRFLELSSPKLDSALTDARGMARLDVCTNYSRGGDVVQFDFTDSDYVVDEAFPHSYVEIPLDVIRSAKESPFRTEIRVISRDEHRRRYPN